MTFHEVLEAIASDADYQHAQRAYVEAARHYETFDDRASMIRAAVARRRMLAVFRRIQRRLEGGDN